jgi:DNA-binding transcriptional ArsR family regulator
MSPTPPGTSLAAVTDQQVRLAVAPLASVTELVFEAMGNPLGSPPHWPKTVREALAPSDRGLLAPIYGDGWTGFFPDCLTPRPESYQPSFDDELAALVEIGRTELEREITEAGMCNSAWSVALCSPNRWLDGYVAALRRAWSVVQQLWLQAAPLVERDIERVAVALARGSFADVVAINLSPRGRVEDDRWYIRDHDPPAVIAPGLVLQPMLVGASARIVVYEREEISHVAYSLPGLHRLSTDGSARATTTGLDALVGGPRADILRRLDRPALAGQLAEDLVFVPSAITHHLVALERAGLASRERRGRHVVVRRTARGTALLNLYEP